MISRCKSAYLPLVSLSKGAFPVASHSPRLPLTSHLQRCSSQPELDPIFAAAIKTNAQQDPFFVNQFATACSRVGQMDFARQVFDEMAEPNAFVYNAVIRGLMLSSSPLDALSFYVAKMRASTRVSPTSYTFVSLVDACATARAGRLGDAVHAEVWKMGVRSQVHIQTALIGFHGCLGRVADARKVFDEMTHKDALSWTAMISVYTQSRDMGSARNLFEVIPERMTATWNTIIAGYARIGDVESAASIFVDMPAKDLISWTSMISCYSQNMRFKEAVDTFIAMQELGVDPDEVTLAAVISSCAHLGAIFVGEGIHQYLTQNRFDINVYIGSSLIDMYGKCGDLRKSLMVFFKLRSRNLFCWNAVIEGLAVHGLGRDALRMYDLMERDEGVKPNGVTFVSLLTACSHLGLVEEGRRIFSRMTQDWGITPEIEHYGCMVDLMGRAGLLQEALELIKSMKIEPNSVIWGSLLSGSKIYNSLEIGQVALQELMALEEAGSGCHALLVNMYAEVNRWCDVAGIRGMIRDRSVQKYNPGCSWIEIDGKVHQFAACDDSHPMADDVCLVLDKLFGQVKLAEVCLF